MYSVYSLFIVWVKDGKIRYDTKFELTFFLLMSYQLRRKIFRYFFVVAIIWLANVFTTDSEQLAKVLFNSRLRRFSLNVKGWDFISRQGNI